jgi:CubicO group peptidase (beta-lactamase class C family)
MRAAQLLILFLLSSQFSFGQNDFYFPPTDGSDEWEAMAFTELGWCQERVDSLYNFLDERNTKGFIVLKDGRIVLEKYFGTFTQDSSWYWASAGKSLSAFLVGLAQEQGFLDIDNPTSDYLGEGWTSCTPEQEEFITVKSQISMTTGLDYEVDDLNCLDPECLEFGTFAGEQWYYHNAPYRLVQDVVANATGQTFNQWTQSALGNEIGMGGLWLNYVRFSKTRDLARFGLLMNANGVWAGDTIMHDQEYFNQMITSSQDLNQAYGYLWWLNGQENFMLPGFNFTFPGQLVNSAPENMYAALGKNDQKIYVVPNENLVVIRVGNAAIDDLAAVTLFDSQLWTELSNMECETSVSELEEKKFSVYPNPTADQLKVKGLEQRDFYRARILNAQGKVLQEKLVSTDKSLNVRMLKEGTYFLQFPDNPEIGSIPFVISR